MSLDPDEAGAWLDSLAGIGWRPGLERIKALCEALGEPQGKYRSIHVVGTNGKTSTTRAATAILSARGIPSGCMTSPHFERWSERVQVDGREADPIVWSNAVSRVREVVPEVEAALPDAGRVTQFEASVAAEFLTLADCEVEVAVVEAGMGGRLDATNAISADVVVLTSVGLDHTEWLGGTKREIAIEKLAVLDPGAILVKGPLEPELDELAARIAADLGCRTVEVTGAGDREWPRGPFRRLALALAEEAVGILEGPSDEALLDRLSRELAVPGRLESVPGDPEVIFDVAHNPDGITALVAALPEITDGRPVVVVFGVLSDKDGEAMVEELAGITSEVVLCRPRVDSAEASGRTARDPDELAGVAKRLGMSARVIEDPVEALEAARSEARDSGALVLLCGSHLLRAALQG